jgi:hypothetical protein
VKTGTIRRAINRYADVYLWLAAFFAFCLFAHRVARLIMEARDRQFALMDDKTLRTMTLIDRVGDHSWLAIAYVVLVVGCVAFLQVRGRPAWTYGASAVLFGLPCILYGGACVHIMMKL